MTAKSKKLFSRAERSLVGGVNSPVRAFRAVGGFPRFIARAKGPQIWDADGQSYIDFVGSWGPMILGHGAAAVLKAVSRALPRGFSYGAPCEAEVQLAELVKSFFPSIDRVRFV